jgi:adenylyltransferase/sulfurtransferase
MKKFLQTLCTALLTTFPIVAFAGNDIPTITVHELKAKIDRKEPFVLVDVREPHELAISQIPGHKLIPLGELPNRLNELNPKDEIILVCRTGNRGVKALQILQKAGFKHVLNLQGGINAWADQIDTKGRGSPK